MSLLLLPVVVTTMATMAMAVAKPKEKEKEKRPRIIMMNRLASLCLKVLVAIARICHAYEDIDADVHVSVAPQLLMLSFHYMCFKL